MKQLLALAIIATLSIVNSGTVHAEARTDTAIENKSISELFNFNNSVLEQVKPPFVINVTAKVQAEPPEVVEPEDQTEESKPVVEYEVVSGDNLTKIAEKHKVTWVRIWQKNTSIKNQDLLYVGERLIIPDASEVLEDRPLFVAPVVATPTVEPLRSSFTSKPVAKPKPVRSRYNSGPNTYAYGNCTYYVKNRRPDIPNTLGNANTWYARAQAMGLPTGTAPRAGAVGTTTRGSFGHVVYVEAVHSDGTITISDMNYRAFNTIDTRRVDARQFVYIY